MAGSAAFSPSAETRMGLVASERVLDADDFESERRAQPARSASMSSAKRVNDRGTETQLRALSPASVSLWLIVFIFTQLKPALEVEPESELNLPRIVGGGRTAEGDE